MVKCLDRVCLFSFIFPPLLFLCVSVNRSMVVSMRMQLHTKKILYLSPKVLAEFTDEEGYGKFLDLHAHHTTFINLKGVLVSQPMPPLLSPMSSSFWVIFLPLLAVSLFLHFSQAYSYTTSRRMTTSLTYKLLITLWRFPSKSKLHHSTKSMKYYMCHYFICSLTCS